MKWYFIYLPVICPKMSGSACEWIKKESKKVGMGHFDPNRLDVTLFAALYVMGNSLQKFKSIILP